MQIRAGNRQDEAIIRTILFQSLEEHGIESDLEGRDKDLRNIEHNYFWYDGLCLVAENDGQIVGFLAGKKSDKSEDTLLLSRLVVVAGARKRGTGRALMKTLIFYSQNMEYKTIEIAIPGNLQVQNLIDPAILQKYGFQDIGGVWKLSVPKPIFQN